jgi:hypothetical protein
MALGLPGIKTVKLPSGAVNNFHSDLIGLLGAGLVGEMGRWGGRASTRVNPLHTKATVIRDNNTLFVIVFAFTRANIT